MKVKNQRLIDKYVAKPVAYLFNFLVRIIGEILNIDHNLNKDFKTIAICKFKGMGSIIQSTPMISAIRRKYPNAKIIFVSTLSNKTLLEKIHWIDQVIIIDDGNLLKFIKTNVTALYSLIKLRPGVYFDLEIYSDYSTLFTLFSLSVNRVGFYLRSSTFNMGIYTHMMFFNPRVPISMVYLQMAQLLNCEADAARIYPLKSTTPLLNQKNGNYIVINPNASDLRLERRWPKQNFIDLIRLILLELPDYDILLIGSKNERDYTESISTALNDVRVKNTSGKTSIDELIGIIANARVMISNDTGPMHVAFCTNTPVLCLFGPCSPEQYGKSKRAYVIYKQVYCSPCVHDFEVPPCKGNNVCMKLITTNEVFLRFKMILEQPHEEIQEEVGQVIYNYNSTVLGKVIR